MPHARVGAVRRRPFVMTARARGRGAGLAGRARSAEILVPHDQSPQVLGELHLLVREWVRKVSINQGMTETMAAETGARIFTFGSYRLGVNGPGADIDTLCIAPRHIDRSRDVGATGISTGFGMWPRQG